MATSTKTRCVSKKSSVQMSAKNPRLNKSLRARRCQANHNHELETGNTRRRNIRRDPRTSDEGYKVILVPGESKGVQSMTSITLLLATLVLFSTWGFAIYYILSPKASLINR